jgi:ABC-type polysaccharide/polyol phosphate transport system ATPase subunit
MSFVIEIEDVWKKFPLIKDRPGIKTFILTLPHFWKKRQKGTFYALKGIQLKVPDGECLGIIGRNGSGKSTLLSSILGGIVPTQGRIRVSKKITPLLELGAGFHPELTGRENIILYGVILGLTKAEVLARMNDIIAYSEIHEFIDMPVRTFSTGMFLRLAFATAIHTDPELLLIDEILAVGDESFQKKSKATLLNLIKKGITTLLASHDLQEIREICSRVVWLDEGAIRMEGDPERVVQAYLTHLR